MAVAALGDVDIELVEDEVGPRAFKRGKDYARRNRVLNLRWDDGEDALVGRVLGHGEVYETTAFFSRDDAGLVFLEGECSCPVAYNCKHVAAIVLAAADAERVASPGRPRSRPSSLRSIRGPGRAVAEAASWEQRLEELLATPPDDPPTARPLGIELALEPPAAGGRLRATIVRQGGKGTKGWVNAGLSWAALDSWQVQQGNYLPAHLQVLRELYALHRARVRSGGEKAIDLGGLGRPLWGLLDEARRVGVRLVHSRPGLGEIGAPATAELRLDVTAPGGEASGGLCVEPRLDVEGVDDPVVPVAFLGADGHGVVYARRAEAEANADPATWRLGLGRLVAPAPTPLQQLVRAGGRVEIPADGRARFVDELWPRLRHVAPVVSSDGAFSPPAIEGPRLVLHADYGLGHALDLSWEWAYDVGGSERRVEVGADPDEAGYRDPRAEQALVASLDADVAAGLARLGLLKPAAPAAPTGPTPTPTPRKQLTGLDTARFTTDVLPRLVDLPDVVVEQTGHPADYREVGDSLVIGFSTDEIPGETDWFDLGVTFSVDGHELPFADVFVALANGEANILLSDGAWFSLATPELESLRRLIEEARTLQDQPGETLRLTRYQAGLWEDLLRIGVVERQAEAWQRQVGALLALADGEASGGVADSAGTTGTTDPSRPVGAVEPTDVVGSTAVSGSSAVDTGVGPSAITTDLAEPAAAGEVAGRAGSTAASDLVDPVDMPAGITAELRPYQRDGFRWLRFLWEHQLGGILADDMGLGKTLQTLALICHAREANSNPSARALPFLIVAPTSVVPNWASEAARFAPDLTVVTVTDTLRRSGRSIEQVVAGADVVVTSYTLFRLDSRAYNGRTWAGLVLDEAQMAKNHRSKVYGCIRRSPAPFKLAITGTPMENNLMELWSLLSITAPGLFPDPDRFAEHYARPIERDGDAERLARLRRRIRPLVKRRTKEHVAADLPPKQEQVLEVELHPRHRHLYETHLQRERQKVLGLIDDFDRNRLTILRSLTLLRQLSLHPALVGPGEGDDGDDANTSDGTAATIPCVKLDTLVEQLDEVVAGGHRALVFSQFTGFLGLVRERLDREGVGYCYLDGRTRGRADVLRRFKEGTDPVFLISLKAGGFGLNLTEADYCFLLDPWWNPATEAQAVDRTHRIGQTRNVIVYRMIARATIEEKVMALKQRKAELFSGLMDDGDLFGTALQADDIRSLFSSSED